MITIPTSEHAEKPQGASFAIDTIPFRYGENVDIAGIDLAEDKVVNWPMVYILHNDDTAYVGQTTSAITRLNQHSVNPEREQFKNASIIFNPEFNASVITDYEHRLIGYMSADNVYKLTNKNAGMSDTNYFSKEEYSKMFEKLWEELRKLQLAHLSMDEIEESEVFKYSPYKGLNPDQRVALEDIMAVIEDGIAEATPIVVEGMPGTGKTVLAVYLLKMLKDDPKYANLNIKLIEPVTSLRNTLKSSLGGITNMSPDDIIAPMDLSKKEYGYVLGEKNNFDIVLVDESHLLKQRVNLGSQFHNFDVVNERLGLPKEATQLDWVLDQAKLAVLFYDPLQAVRPACVSPEQMRASLGGALDKPISLDCQMRVKGGKRYLEFIQAILSDENPEPARFQDYELVFHDSFSDFVASFEETYSKHELTRMLAGYAWEWKTNKKRKPSPGTVDIEIDGIGLKWNFSYDNWIGAGFDHPEIAHEVGCIHSSAGYDLSYAYVLLGPDIKYDVENECIVTSKADYYDKSGKNTTTPEELDEYIRRIYYVLLTRGIYGTHIYVYDDALRSYLSKFFT